MDAKVEELTVAEREYLEHARAAQAQGMKLVEYYRAQGLSEDSLYNARRGLIKKGIVERRRVGWSTARKQADRFIAVSVAKSAQLSAGGVCRLRHPSGWVLECTSWPQAGWLRELTGERS